MTIVSFVDMGELLIVVLMIVVLMIVALADSITGRYPDCVDCANGEW